jgi:hypothetical protein
MMIIYSFFVTHKNSLIHCIVWIFQKFTLRENTIFKKKVTLVIFL